MRPLSVLVCVVMLAVVLVGTGCPEEPVVEPPTPPEPVQMLEGVRVAIMVAEGFHDGETLRPKEYLEDQGAQTVIIGPAVGEVTAYNSDQTVQIEMAVADASVEEFDGLILPGGHGPGVLREHEPAVEFARAFVESGKLVAAICHGPQVLVTAGVLEGRTVTGVSGIADELREAGAEYLDEPVVMDDNLVTSRVPDDIPMFNSAILGALMEMRPERR